LEKSLQSLAGGAAPERLRPLLTTVLDRLRGGRGLAEALEDAAAEAKKPLFPPYFIAMIRAGEAAGALEAVLGKLAELLERALRLRETLISALIYPIILTVVAISSVVLLLTVVVPQFAPLFANSPHQLPWATTLVLGASRLLREWGALGISLLLAGGLAAPRLLRRWGASGWWDRTVLRLPVAGPLVVAIATARLSRTLGILLKSGVPLPAALGLTRGIVGNRVLAEMLDALRDGIANGRGLTASLPEGHPLPDLAVQLLRVGEQSGRLEEILLRLADLFDDRVELAQKRLLAIFEPACVLTLSAIVGGIVISILQAVVSINDLAL
jgi:general secretion pathway protein F